MSDDPREIKRIEHWREMIKQFDNRPYGMSAETWCKQHHVSETVVYRWRSKFRQMDAQAAASRSEDANASCTSQVPDQGSIDSPLQCYDITSIVNEASASNPALFEPTALVAQHCSPVIPDDSGVVIQKGDFLIHVGSNVQTDLLTRVLKAVSDA